MFIGMVYSINVQSQTIISKDSLDIFEIEAGVRNGNTGYEGALITTGETSKSGQKGVEKLMNPPGEPVWNSEGNVYGDIHSFRYRFFHTTGISVWNIDFNRDGDYGDIMEEVTETSSSLAGKDIIYLNLMIRGHSSRQAALLHQLEVNGLLTGPYLADRDSLISIMFKDASGSFRDIEVNGLFSFTGNNDEFRPGIWIRLASPACINQPPTCAIAGPLHGSTHPLTDSLLINVSASDPDGSVVKVEFFINSTKVGEDIVPPFSFKWKPLSSGTYTLTARAMDNRNACTYSDPVQVFISEENQLPVCSMIHPLPGTIVPFQSTLLIEAEASDPDGQIVILSFNDESGSIGVDSLPPYSIEWLPDTIGPKGLFAVAVDDRGAVSSSDTTWLIVNDNPDVSLLYPADGSEYLNPDSLVIQLQANDRVGGIGMVQMNIDSIPVAEITSEPYMFTFMNPSLGIHEVQAVVTDIYGGTTVSDPVRFNILCYREDLNQDGTVNVEDFILFTLDFGIFCPPGFPSDFNDSGKVDVDDFIGFVFTFGKTCN